MYDVIYDAGTFKNISKNTSHAESIVGLNSIWISDLTTE